MITYLGQGAYLLNNEHMKAGPTPDRVRGEEGGEAVYRMG